MWFHDYYGGCTLIIIGGNPHFRGCLVRLWGSLGVVLIPCHKSVINQSYSLLVSKMTEGERLRARDEDTKWRQGCQVLILLLVNIA
jgi:hypothetical protein